LLSAVFSFRHFIAVVLLALWLPATQHCGLEAAGFFSMDGSHGTAAVCCNGSGTACSHDGCRVVESEVSKPTNEAIKVPAPSLLACACFICLQLLIPDMSAEPTLVVAEADRAQRWVPAWHFVRRAALPARAPSLVA